MNDLKALILEVEAAEKNGAKFTCAFSDSRTAMRATNTANTGGVTAQWHAAVANEMQHSRCDKKKATALVVRKYPELRAALVAEANATSTVRSTASTSSSSTVRKSPVAAFNAELQRLMDGGMTKLEAAKLLSKRMGLSSNEPTPGFVSTRQQYR